MTPLEFLLMPHLAQLALELARITGLIIITPIPWEVAPQRVKAAMVMFLALIVHSMEAPAVDLGGPLDTAVLLFTEFVIGAAMGFVVRLAVSVAEIAGTTVAPIIGFGAASIFDPNTGEQDSILTRLFRQFYILLALVVGAHRIILGSLVTSFRELPVGSAVHLENGAAFFIQLSSHALSSGVRLALPLLAILLMVQLALAFVSRAAPSMQIFSIGFAVLLATGAVVLYLTVPDLALEMLAEMSSLGEVMESVLVALSTAPE